MKVVGRLLMLSLQLEPRSSERKRGRGGREGKERGRDRGRGMPRPFTHRFFSVRVRKAWSEWSGELHQC